MRQSILGFGIAATVVGSAAQAVPFDISVSFATPLGDAREAAFTEAATLWESVITGYRTPGFDRIDTLRIETAVLDLDADGPVLGRAGPRRALSDGTNVLTRTGAIVLNRADVDRIEADGRLTSVILHEMAHVIGFGNLWEINGLSSPGSGRYTGQYGLEAYRDSCDPTADFVPVELEGSALVADTHWDEAFGGSGNGNGNGTFCASEPDAYTELMTGWLNVSPFVSPTTIASFADLGYTTVLTDPVAAVPLPATGLLAAGGLLGLGMIRRRRGSSRRARSAVDTTPARS